MSMRVANAPVSFGIFELTAPGLEVADPEELCRAVAAAGYEGIDLGPIGYLGRGPAIGERLRRHGLSLSGGWIDLSFSDQPAFEADLPRLEEALDIFEASLCGVGGEPPKPTLADSGSPGRRAYPGRGETIPELRLSDAQWDAFARRVGNAAERVRARGFEPTFHHHASTYVESPAEIEELLERTDIGLCLDTGHLVLGGGDPLAALSTWAERINHVHVKDCRLAVLERCIQERASMREVWRAGVFCPLGAGDVDIHAILSRLAGRSGWLVVEQDVLADGTVDLADAARQQAANRELLRAYGL